MSRCQSAKIFIGKVKAPWKVCSNAGTEWMCQSCETRWDVVGSAACVGASLEAPTLLTALLSEEAFSGLSRWD